MVLSFVDRLGSDRPMPSRIDGLKRDLLARPELADLGAQHLVERAKLHRTQRQRREPWCCSSIWPECSWRPARRWPAIAELRGEINQGLVAVLRSFIADQKSGVSSFISDQVKAWDMGQLISLIEINIGRDLQYIRFNGSLIGGLAGLGLYTAECPAAVVVDFWTARSLLSVGAYCPLARPPA